MDALQLISNREVQVRQIEPPAPPKAGEARVKIRVVALNHLDVWGWRGMAFAERSLPLTIGAEASGEIVEIGSDADGFAAGQLVSLFGAKTCGVCRPCLEGRDNLCTDPGGVHGFHLDGFAREYVTLPVSRLVPAPQGCDEVQAAVAPITFGTPEHMLFDNARLESGQTVLVHAGGSGIGSAAIQLAKKTGCQVIATVGSDEKIARCEELGADHVINYEKERFARAARKITQKRGVDAVFEHVGASTWQESLLALKRGGVLVTCGSTSGVSAPTNLMMLFQRQLRLIGSFGCSKANMASVMGKMAQGSVKPVIDSEIQFGDMKTALERMESRKVFGKIIMRIG